MDSGSWDLSADAADGHILEGRVLVTRHSFPSRDLELQGTGPLRIDGKSLASPTSWVWGRPDASVRADDAPTGRYVHPIV